MPVQSVKKENFYNVELERKLIACLLLDGEQAKRVRGIVMPEHFYTALHREIYNGIISLTAAEKPVEIVLLDEKLKGNKIYDQLGGQKYLAEFLIEEPTGAKAYHYAKQIRELGALRQLQAGFEDMSKINLRGVNLKSVLESAQNLINKAQIKENKEKLVRFDPTAPPDDETANIVSLPLTFCGEDNIVFAENLCHIFSAYPKMGKSTFMAHAVNEWMNRGKTVAYLSEEPTTVWHQRKHVFNAPGKGEVILAFGLNKDELLDVVKSLKQEIVIIDTVRMLGFENENDNAEVQRVIRPFIVALRQHKKTGIFIHHTGKGQHLTPGASTSGAHAFTGVMDVVVEMGPANQDPSADLYEKSKRKLTVISRVFECPPVIYAMSDKGPAFVGGVGENKIKQVTDEVYHVLDENWTSTTEIHNAIPIPCSKKLVQNSLRYLARTYSYIERSPGIEQGDVPGKSYKWRRVPKEIPNDKQNDNEEVNIDDVSHLF